LQDLKNNLEKFIANIENCTISKNEIVIGFLSHDVIEFLTSASIVVETKEIYLSVKAYKHIQRDFKKRLKKSVSKELMLNLYRSFEMPYKIFFDSEKKHCNLIYVDRENELLFKIVVQPNYIAKKGIINTVITAGIIDESALKSKFYKEITEHGWESNPR
jgi:hypothetical protein